MKKQILTIGFLFLSIFLSLAQGLTQTVKGRVVDQQAGSPLPFVNVTVQLEEGQVGASTDIDGYYKLENIPVGRHTIEFSFLGYKPMGIPNVVVNSAKELVVDVKMEESISELQEVVVDGGPEKFEVINEMATVSTRQLNILEGMKYSGTRGDPARMAQNFAGVSGVSDDRNDIIIRGNSPSGVLWRMEGLDIPNPNHFGTLGTTGGPVTMLNSNNLKDSDFMTSAFPAQYGNATSGVFDLNLRNGNKDKYEFLGQVGFNGFELGAEGPFSKNSKASFMVNYRYSTLGLMSAIGIDFGTGAAIPEYQDLTFKINVPTKNAGKFELFGIGGKSYIEFLGSEQEEPDLFSEDGEDLRSGTDMGVVGMSHTHFFNKNTFGKVLIGASAVSSNFNLDSLSIFNGDPTRIAESDANQVKYTASYMVNSKLNARNQLRAGVFYDLYNLKLEEKAMFDELGYQNIRNFSGNASLLRSYIQWQHRFTDNLTLNSGLHHMHFFLNNSWVVEPRINLKYEMKNSQSLSFGTGLHSQLQPVEVYFLETNLSDNTTTTTNSNLDLLKSAQLVVGYDKNFNKNFRIKTEAYYQHLLDAAVEGRSNSFSMLNAGADFGFPNVDSLTNDGFGRNYGLEITVEKFFDKGYYFLFTSSLFNSEYKGSDDVWRNTAFNSNYVFNLLGGYEWKFGKGHALLVDARVVFSGGRRYTEIDLEASRAQGREVLIEDQAFENQYRPYFRPDLKISYAHEGKRVTQKFSVDLQNFIGYQNIFDQSFNNRSGDIVTTYQIGFFPDVQYRILF